ncbi:MAG: hypothetical protein ABIO72_03135 [Patescibacteria group bacterium]
MQDLSRFVCRLQPAAGGKEVMYSHSPFRKVLLIALLGVSLCVFGSNASAATGINRQINYQGRLLTSGGSSVSNGSYLLKLSIYDVANGGTALWTASGSTSTPGAVSVTVTNGLFSIQLGDTGAGQNPFTFDFHQDSLYLGVTVASDTEMTPRKRLTSVPYAFEAEALQGQNASSSVLSTGGNLFALHQGSNNAATGDRTALFVQTSGTSNVFDYLIKANSGADVFTVSRQGNVTTTGNFANGGNAILGDASSDSVVVNAHISSDLIPTIDATYSLGTASLRWLTLNAVNVSSTNVTTTNLFVNGQAVCLANGVNCQATSGTAQTFQQVTTAGNTTTNQIFFAGGSSTAVFEASGLIVDGGTEGIGDFDGFPAKLLISSPDETYWSEVYQNLTADALHPTSTAQWAHYVSDFGELSIWSVQGAAGPAHEFLKFLTPEQLAAFGFANPDENWGVFLSEPGAVLAPFANNSNDLGVAYSAWRNVYASGTLSSFNGLMMNQSTTTNATTTNSFVSRLNFTNGTSTGSFNFNSASGSSLFVTGQAVCLANGTNCPASAPSAESDTLLSVTNRGSVATATLTLYGGATVGGTLTATGTFAVTGTATSTFAGPVSSTRYFTDNYGSGAAPSFGFNGTGGGFGMYMNGPTQLVLAAAGAGKLFVDANELTTAIPFRPLTNNTTDIGVITSMFRNGYFAGQVSSTGLLAYNVTSTNATTTNFAFTNASGSSLFVQGQAVCLANGTNCPSSSPSSIASDWTYNAAADTLRPVTSTADILIGGATPATSPFWFNTNNSSSSRLFIGGFGSSTDIVVGASTSSITNPNFQLDGNDLFVAGNIGSASSIYTNAAFIAGAGTTLYGDGFITKTNGSLTVSSSADVLFNQNGNVGIHNTAPQEALDVTGSIRNVLAQGQTFSVLGRSVVGSDTSLAYPVVVGNHLYAVNRFDSPFPLVVFDITNSTQPVKVASVTTCLGVTYQNNLMVVGNYAYVLCDYNPGPSRMQIFDVSAPTAPALLSTISLGSSINLTSIAVNGQYAYVTVETDGTLRTIDISDPANPAIIGSTALPGASSSAWDVKVSGRYAYVVGPNADEFWVLDLVDPAVPVVVGDTVSPLGSASPITLAVRGRYAYTMNSGDTTIGVIDVSDPTNPFYVTSTPLDSNATYLDPTIVGNYLLVSGAGGPQFYDISSSTNPVFIGTAMTSPNDSVTGIAISGKNVLVTDESAAQVTVINMPGVETAGLRAANAELGTLDVLTDGQVGQNLFVGNSLSVGNGGISSMGPIVVQGKLVCLSDGTNCPVSGGGGATNFWSFNATTDSLYPATSTSDVLIGGATAGSSPFRFLTQTTSSRLFVGANGSSTDVVIGGATSTVSNTNFQLNGGSLFVNNNIGSASSVYTNGAFISGPGSTLYGDGFASKTNGAFILSSTGGDLTLQTITSGNIILDPVTNGAGTTTFGGTTADRLVFTARISSDLIPSAQGAYYMGTSTAQWKGLEVVSVTSSNILTGNLTATNIVTNNLTVNNSITVSTTAPTLLTNFNNNNVVSIPTDSSIAISGKYAYIGSRGSSQGRFGVIDISNPASVTSVGVLNSEFGSFSYNSVVASGKYVYVGANSGMISVHDISNPAVPVRTNEPSGSNYFSPGSITSMFDLAISGKYLYAVGNTPSVFNVIDTASSSQKNATSKNQLSVVSTYTSSTAFSTARGLVVQGGYAYVAANGQITVLDVTSPATTTIKGMTRDTTRLASAQYMAMQGKRLYVAATNRFTIVDVSNASSPTTVGSLLDATNLAGASHVALAGNIAYVTATTNHKVLAIDVSDPTNPIVLGVFTDATNMNSPYGITVNGNHAYVAHGSTVSNSGITVLNLSGYEMGGLTVGSIDAGSIRTGESVDIGGNLNVRGGITSDGGGIWTSGGLGVFGTATSSINGNLNLLNGLQVDGGSIVHNIATNVFDTDQVVSSTVTFYHTEVIGRYLYALRNTNTFAIYDVSNTSTITQIGQVVSSTALSAALSDFAISGKYAFAITGIGSTNRLISIDISNPTAPTIVSTTSIGGVLASAQTIEIKGSYAYVAHSNVGSSANVSIWDISNPFAPTLVRIISYNGRFGGSSMTTIIQDNFLYVGGNSPAIFTIVDISNPLAATSTGSVAASVGPNGLAARGKWVFAESNGSSLQVIDVSSSTSPTVVTCGSTASNGFALVLMGNTAIIGTQGGASNGLAIMDITSPGNGTCNTVVERTVSPSANATHLTLAGRRLFLSSTAGLHVITMSGIDAGSATIGSIYGDAAYFTDQITVNGFGNFANGVNSGGEIIGSSLLMRGSGTSTFFGTVSTTQLYVGGQLVCLANGTNCPAASGGSGSVTWSYNALTDTLSPATSTTDVLIGGSTTGSSPFWFNTNNSSSSRLFIGGFGSSTDIVVGASTSTITNTNFQLDGNDLFVAGNIGSASSVYTNGAFIAGPGSTIYADGLISKTNGDLTLNASSGVIRPTTNNRLSLGSATASFANIYSSGTVQFVNASGSSLELNKTINPTVVGSVPISGTVNGTAISGRYAYIANTSATSGLVIADIADPTYPSVVATMSFGFAVNDIAIQGSYAYLASDLGIHAVDIRNPSSPSSVGFVQLANTVLGVAVSGKYAYAVADTIVSVIDISNPANPINVFDLNAGSATYARVAVQGAYLYAVDDTDGLDIFDIVDPTHPALLYHAGGAGDAHNGVYVSGKYAYVAGGGEGLVVFDISNPYNVPIKSATLTPGGASDVTVAGKLAYIADGTVFTVFDVSSSTNPVSVSSIPLTNSLEVTVSGKHAYVGRIGQVSIVDLQGADIASAQIGSLQSNQMTVLDTLDVGNTVSIRNSLNVGRGGILSAGPIVAPSLTLNAPQLTQVGDYTPTGGLVAGLDIAVSGHYGYAALSGAGFQVLDLMRPDNITPLGSVAVSSISQLAVAGRYVYAVQSSIGADGLYIFDVSNPSAPTTTGSISSGLTDPSNVYVSGKYAYISVVDGLSIVDISNPSKPQILSYASASPTGFVGNITVDKGYAYVAKVSGGFTIFDVSNPSAPTSVGALFTASSTRGVAVSDGYAYLTKSNGKLEIINVSNPAAPVLVGSIVLPDDIRGMTLAGKYVYLQGTATLSIVDVSIPSAPVRVAQTPVADTGRDLAVSGRYLYSIGGSSANAFLRTYDLGGADIANATIGSLQMGVAAVDTNLTVGNDLMVRHGLNVGGGGIHTDGTISASGLSLTSFTSVTTVASVIPGGSFDADTIDIQGKYAYITDAGSVKFRVYDITRPSAPTLVTSTTIGSIGQMEVAGRYAYVANGTGSAGFEVVDISNPSSPTIIGTMASASSASGGLAVAGNNVYLSASAQGVRVIDITDPTTPTTTGFARGFSNPQTIRIQGRYAYVSDLGGSAGFVRVVDTASSTAPSIIGSLSMTSYVYDMAVQGKYLYGLDGTNLDVVDVSNPKAPVQVATSTHHASAGASALVLYGNYVIVALAADGVEIFDVSNPLAPVSVKYLPDIAQGHYCSQLRVVGRYLYGACTEGFFTYDLGGASITSLEAGSIAVTDLWVSRDVSIGNNLEVGGGIIAGLNGIHTDGELSGRSLRAIQNNRYTTGTAALFYKSVTASSLASGGWQAGVSIYTTGTAGSFSDIPAMDDTFTFGSTVQSASAYIVNGFTPSDVATSNNVSLLAVDMTSSTFGGAIFGARKCGSSTTGNIMKLATDTDTSRFTFRCSGQLFADSGTVGSPADYAEYFPTTDIDLSPGEVVALTSDSASSVKRAMATNRESVIGVISAHPLVLGNAGPDGANESNPNYKIVGLLGQLPVKVSSVNGPIMAGDKLMAGDNGYAVKATGVGLVIGRALENLVTATGTVNAYVKPEWSGDGIFDAGNGTTNITSQGTASSSLFAYDSYGLTFQGSAWDVASSTAITSSFTLVNDVISATSSIFRIDGTLGNSLLTISDLGDVGITGDLTVGHRLFLGSKAGGLGSTSTYLFVDDTQAPSSTYIATNADGWSTATTYDYAERFASNEELVAGDLVMVDSSDVSHVKKTTNTEDNVMGIVSTKPGFITGAYATGTYPIALAGRVPTRVSTSNGSITAGDELAPSNEAGVAIKATGSGPTIGIALENYVDFAEGKINVFVKPGWKMDIAPSAPTAAAGVSSRSGLAKLAAGATSVDVSFASISAYPLITVTPYGLPTSAWGITNVTDYGFTITLSHPESFDLVFSWKVEPSGAGAQMSFSDGTSAPYDPLTGQPTVSAPSAPTSSASGTDPGT